MAAPTYIPLHRDDESSNAPQTRPLAEAQAQTADPQSAPRVIHLKQSAPRLQPVDEPRIIPLGSVGTGDQTAVRRSPTRAGRHIDIDPGVGESALARAMKRFVAPNRAELLSREEFAEALHEEWARHQRGGRDGAVASLMLIELDAVRLRLGERSARELLTQVADMIRIAGRPLDVLGMAAENEIVVLMPDLRGTKAQDALEAITTAIATTVFTVGRERVLLTPAAGFAQLSDTESAADLIRAAERARAVSMLNLDLGLQRWEGELEPVSDHAPQPEPTARWKERLRTPFQIALTFLLGWVAPFVTYVGLAAAGFDISWVAYLLVLTALCITAAFILWEGALAFRQKEPPAVPTAPYPRASAIIAAYLPNEAATVVDTVEAFLELDYPNEIQIILAYNTPETLPVEQHLDRLAAKHPNFVPVRVVGSNSKAQNVNAVLSMADGEFIGMFDADHQPRPDAFRRAWRWIDSGYDVVQGHCLTRNGDSGWLVKMIAVEFESIYAVAHPGRARMHRFGVFGGSNGFWRTELLHETRMRGSMLTEDIDSSMRVVERGYKIRSDRNLVSRELGTTTFRQIWNQRMRWAQGWFQVSIEHTWRGIRSKHLSLRQKFGLFHLLMWREVYPWISLQIIPLLAYFAYRDGGVSELTWTNPLFLATTIFTLHVGPMQTVFAYLLSDREIKRHASWFVGYLFFASLFYTEYKNLIARVAHVKEFMGERDWRVTPRSADPV